MEIRMFIPVGTDNPMRHRPIVNYWLIAVNVAVFLFVQQLSNTESFRLTPDSPRLYQFITYAFLHGGWLHIIGNMLFLYIFGNNVNDKLGNLNYLLFYLAGGVFSGIGHTLVSANPVLGALSWGPPNSVLGASGAVAAVTGAYMVLFPKTKIHIIYFYYLIGETEWPAIYFILFKLVIFDNIVAPKLGGPSHIAYSAHLAGYFIGIVVPMAMLAFKLLPHSHYDLWALAKRQRRRQVYRSTVRNSYDPFDPTGRVRKKVDAKVTTVQQENPKVTQLRDEIAESFYQSDLESAAKKYVQLKEIDPVQILPQQQQLDIANKLMQIGQHKDAAVAYEDFIKRYHRYPFMEQVALMLGLIYSRYLHEKEPARQHLQNALEKLSDPGQKQMCKDELEKL